MTKSNSSNSNKVYPVVSAIAAVGAAAYLSHKLKLFRRRQPKPPSEVKPVHFDIAREVFTEHHPPLSLPPIKPEHPVPTPYEQTLLNALRREPTGLEMWKGVGGGNPNLKHREITAMLIYCMDKCTELGAEGWADWGTLLGALRHRGVIPWDWDFDFSFRSEDMQKILPLLDDKSHPVYGWRWYEDPAAPGYTGYGSKGFCCYNKVSDPVVLGTGGAAEATLGDIVEYRDPRPDEPQDELVCVQEDWHYPNRKLTDIYPLTRVHLLGTSMLLPAKPKSILSWYEGSANTTYSATKVENYDPVPFLLSHMHNPLLELHCKPPVSDATECKGACDDWKSSSFPMPSVHRGAADCRETGEAWCEKPGVHVLGKAPSSFPASGHSPLVHVHHECVFAPSFMVKSTGYYVRVVRGRFELLSVPPHLRKHLEGISPNAMVDELLWAGKSELWSAMVGTFLEAGDAVFIPPEWAFRFRAILPKDLSPAICISVCL